MVVPLHPRAVSARVCLIYCVGSALNAFRVDLPEGPTIHVTAPAVGKGEKKIRWEVRAPCGDHPGLVRRGGNNSEFEAAA